MALITDGSKSFVSFHYGDMTWASGALSDNPAVVEHYFTICLFFSLKLSQSKVLIFITITLIVLTFKYYCILLLDYYITFTTIKYPYPLIRLV